jgi:WXXGXW repeat (2 copies)
MQELPPYGLRSPSPRNPLQQGTTGQAKDLEDKVRAMTIKRLVRKSIGVAVLSGVLLGLAVAPTPASARVYLSVGFAPPLIPVYEQPIAPGYGYIWTPGSWVYDDGWVWQDGAWVEPPYAEALWTPGYWGWGGGVYLWHAGYWGRSIGYYGGINYGFGYFGTGFYGGYWNGGHFFYNAAYNHIGFHNSFVYSHPVAGFESGRPGGAAFARVGAGQSFNHGSFDRASAVNGNSFAGRGSVAENRGSQSFAASNHSTYSGGSYAQHGSSAPETHASAGGGASGGRASYGGGGHSGGGRR